MSRDQRLYLEDIRDCCRKVLLYTRDMTLEQLIADDRTFDAIMRNMEITGEAAKHVAAEIKARYPEVEWRSIAGFRDVAIHAYPTIDEEIVWDIVTRKAPELLQQVERILAAEFPGEDTVL